MSLLSYLLVTVFTIGVIIQVVPAAERLPANLISNPDFESEGGWRSNWEPWPGVKARMQMLDDPRAAFNGRRSLEVECTRNSSGLTQWASNAFPIKKDQAYRITFQYRGKAIAKLGCYLREVPPPWAVHGTVTVSPVLEWNRAEFIAVASKDVNEAAIFFSFEGVGTVWIDDVSVFAIDLPKVEPKPTGNLLPNASFELPPNYMDWGMELSAAGYEIDAKDHTDGRHSLRMLTRSAALKWGQIDGNLLRGPAVPVREFCDHTFSAKVRADKPTKVTLSLRSGSLTLAEQVVDAGPDWRGISVTGNTKLGNRCYVQVESDGPFAIDETWLAEGRQAPAEYESRTIESVVQVMPSPSKMFALGESVSLKIAAINRQAIGRKQPYRLFLQDFDGRKLPLPAGEVTSGGDPVTVTFRPDRYGPFRVVLEIDGAQPALDAFAVVPARSLPPSPDTPFGGHIGGTDPVMLDMVQKMGLGWQRALWPPGITQWRSVEPEKGKWVFKDEQVAAFQAAHIGVMGNLQSTPDWAMVGQKQSAPGSAYNMGYPNDINDWRKYAATVARHYPQITTWELFNEPNVGIFWPGTHEQLMELARSAVDAIREVNPNAKFVVQAFPSLDALKEAGVLQHTIAISEHWYAHGSTVDARVDQISGWIVDVRKKLLEIGMPQIEIWNTEFGAGTWGAIRSDDKDLLNRRAVEYVTKHLASQRAQGVGKFFPYHLRPAVGAEGNNMFDKDRTPTTGVAAYAIMVYLLEHAKPAGELKLKGEWLRAYQFRAGSDLLVFAWSREPGKAMPLGKPIGAIRAYDTFYNPIAGDVVLEQMPRIFMGPEAEMRKYLSATAP